MRTESINKSDFISFLGRAEEFFQAMKILLDLQERYHAAALLGIHAAIAMNDAITVGSLGKRCRSENHADAKSLLKQVCSVRQIQEPKGISHLSDMLGLKTDIAYGKRFLSGQLKEPKQIHDRCQKFFAWAYVHFPFLSSERSLADEVDS